MTDGLRADLRRRGERLRDHLLDLMARGVETELAEDAFDALALEVFRFQIEAVPVYGAFARGRGVDPERLGGWSAIPPVPARAFAELRLAPAGEAEAVFRTSGTTRGGSSPGTHHVRDLALYRASLLPNATAHLNPEGEQLRVLALLPPRDARPDSSLVHMTGVLADSWDDGGGGFFADAEWRLDGEGIAVALARAEGDGVAVLVIGTAFAFVHLLDLCGKAGTAFRLPAGSRAMETGGFKGRSREVARAELYGAIRARLGIPESRIVNEYGMTELLSQFYEPCLRRPGERELRGPPWARTRVLDPESLRPLPPGEPGILCHMDLANLFSVSAVLTEDRGVQPPGSSGFRVLGREAGAEPRGCSLAMEEILEGGAGRRG